jgi:hypothetical protein
LLYPVLVFIVPIFTALIDLAILMGQGAIGVGKYVYFNNTDKVSWKTAFYAEWAKSLVHAIQPVKDFAKNLLDTFKPYKYSPGYEALRILEQPLEGFALICSGIWRTLTTPVVGIVKMSLAAISMIGAPHTAVNKKKYIGEVFSHTASHTVNGIFRIVTGALQLALTPFSLLVKPLLRMGITLITDVNDKPKIETNPGMQERIRHLHESVRVENNVLQERNLAGTCADIHRKFLKCQERGEATNVVGSAEFAAYAEVEKNNTNVNYDRYLSLFVPANPSIERTVVRQEDPDAEPGMQGQRSTLYS